MRIIPFIRSPKVSFVILLSFYRIWLIKSHSRFWTWNNRQRLSTSTADKSVDDQIAANRRSFVRHWSFVRHFEISRGGDHMGNDGKPEQNDGSEEDVGGGGSDDDNDEMEDDEAIGIDGSNDDEDFNDITDTEDSSSSEIQVSSESEVSQYVSMTPQRKNRHSSDVIIDLSQRSVVDDGEQSWALRQLITTRTSEFLMELEQRTDEIMVLPKKERSNKKLAHPRKLLHFLAPKIPAIKQSPDVNLRIHSSRSDIDPGCAACIIGMLAHACELYDGNIVKIGNSMERSASFDIIGDRRFEQLVECVISGINIEKRIRESKERDRQLAEEESNKKKKHDETSSLSVIENDIEDDDGQQEEQMTDIEDVLDQEDVQFDEGIGIRDGCRAAYGIAVLGTQQVSSLGGVVINDLILALSLRVRELLLARLQLLRRDDILEGIDDGVTTEERLDQLSEELAQDTASTLWTFACVRVLTGCRSPALIETCCGILCSQPKELRHRAQEAPYESGSSIGSSDVIERLARSEVEALEPEQDSIDSDIRQKTGEIDRQSDNDRFDDQFVIDQRDILLDWLSPTEVADMLWGIALHGSSNETSVKDEIDLSVTAASLREAASDRIIEWLKNDLRDGRDAEADKDISPSTSSTTTESIESDDTKVEITEIDEETGDIQSAEDDVAQDNEADSDLTSTPVHEEPEMQEVPVVDAASLLSSYNNEEEIQIETEVLVAPVPVMESDDNAYGERTDQVRSTNSANTIFSSHDLASIAWSLTELNDTCKVQIVGMVMERLSQLEPFGITNLSGNDLSNLAWAISKDNSALVEMSLSLISSIITTSLENARDMEILEFLQPPELGRLMWASAWVVSTRKTGDPAKHQDLKSMRAFSDMALNAAAESSDVFNPEELARILYAWLELSGPDYTNLDLKTAESLGRVVSTIEQSLQRWEKGDLPTGPSQSNSQAGPPTTLFGSIFGRSRFNPLMEHAVVHTEEEDDLRYHRPKLRDLNLDPSTLIKIALGVNRLSTAQKSMVDLGHVLTRIAVRLMSSKSGKLMRVCSIDDIARLCEAACLSSNRFDLSIGYFSRQTVQVLNEGVDYSDLPMQMKCTLVWSLGRLGIRCSSDAADKHKLDTTHVSKILEGIDLSKLELESLCRLLEGLLATKYVMVSDSTFLLELLTYLERILQETVSSNDILCDVAETLGVLMEEEIRTKESREENVDTELDAEDNGDESVGDDESPGERTVLTDSQSILRSIASLIKSSSNELTSSQICRILGVYCMLPFQADDMIESVAEEISVRRAILESLSGESDTSLEVLLRRADEKIENLQSTLFEESTTSIFDSLKAGIVSFFSLDEAASTEEDDLGKAKEEVASMIRDCLSASSAPSRRIAKEQDALKRTVGTLIKESEDSVALELGKAEELIQSYRRVEFVDGTATRRQSRYDQERREIITKRVLSRLLP